MESYFVTYKSSQIHYCKIGQGNKLLLCFHGYGESADSFSFLKKYLADDYTLIAIDFPFHGKTIWNEGLVLEPADILIIIEKIMQGISINTSKKYMIGYSMGGRVVLDLIQYIPDEIEKIILLAPDGLTMSFWYWLATQTIIGNKLFRFTMNHPGWFFLLLKTANKIRMINQSVFKFSNNYINDKKARDELYNRWTVMRKFKPKLKDVKELINNNRIQTNLLYGKYDRVIRYQNAEKIKQGIKAYCTVTIINSGHQLLQEKNVAAIISLLKTD